MGFADRIQAVTLAIGVLTLLLGVLTLYLDHRRRRRQATLEAYLQAGQYRRELQDAVNEAHADNLRPYSLEWAYKLSSGDSRQTDNLREYLNFWEQIAVGVQVGVFDHKTLKIMSQWHLSNLYKRYASYIYFIRQHRPEADFYRALTDLAVEFGAEVDERAFGQFLVDQAKRESRPSR